MINKVTLIGRLGQDPEIRYLENGASVARMNLATNENYKDREGNWQDRTEWHTVIAWRFLAEKAEKSLKKGALVFVEGKLATRKWQDKDGNERRTTEVVAAVLRLLDRRENGGGGNYPPLPNMDDDVMPSSVNTTPTASSTPKAAAPQAPSIPEADDDDLPF